MLLQLLDSDRIFHVRDSFVNVYTCALDFLSLELE